MATEPKYDEDTVNLGYLKKVIANTEESIDDIYKNIFKNGGRCDFDITYCDAADAVKAIKESGGTISPLTIQRDSASAPINS